MRSTGFTLQAHDAQSGGDGGLFAAEQRPGTRVTGAGIGFSSLEEQPGLNGVY